MAKSASIATVRINTDDRAVVFIFDDGHEETFRADDMPAAMQTYAMLHGMQAKLRDCYAAASSKGPEAELTPLAWAKREQQEVWSAILDGDWNRAGSGSPIDAEAISRATGKTVEEAIKLLKAVSEETLKAIRKTPEFKAAKAEIQAERAKARADRSAAGTLDDLLS